MRSIRYSGPLPRWWWTGIVAAATFACFCINAAQAFAEEGGKSGAPSEGLFLIQIVVLVVIGRLLGEAMVRIGQPSIMGQIIGGILLGPSVLGMIWPHAQQQLFPSSLGQKSMTDAVGQLGVLFLLLLAGMETDLGLAKRLRKAALGVSLTGIVIPFIAGFALGELIPESFLPDPGKRLVTSLFLGTALSISSVKIVASVVREMDFMRRNIGQLIVASAIIDDTVGWVIIAVTFSLAEKGSVDLFTLARSVLGTLAFMAFSFTIGRRLVFEIIRFTNDKFKSDLPVLSAIIAIMGVMAIVTNLIGVNTVLGAFVAGILVGESPILTRQIDEQLRALTTALFMPVFFGLTGLHTDLTVLADTSTLLLVAGLILIASIGKFGGAFAGARFGGFSNSEAIALGCGMNARGSTEVIVATIGLSVGVLDQRLFSIIVAMAVVTTMAMPPTLRWALARLPMRDDERDRLKHEEFEERSYLAKFERMLLAIDLSPSGNLAARISGHFAAVRKTPVTVLDIVSDEPSNGKSADGNSDEVKQSAEERAKAGAERVEASADKAAAAAHKTQDTEDGDIHITTKIRDANLPKLLGEGAQKGHDLLFIGIDPSVAPNGGFNEQLSIMANAFKGTTAIVSSRGPLPEADKDLRILVPVSGTERSTRAAELAFVIARASACEISVVYIREPQQIRSLPRLSDTSNAHIALFRKIDEIAAYNGVKVRKIVQDGAAPELAILRHARKGSYNLIVLGVSRRAGDHLSYGTIADTLLETADRSFVFFETE